MPSLTKIATGLLLSLALGGGGYLAGYSRADHAAAATLATCEGANQAWSVAFDQVQRQLDKQAGSLAAAQATAKAELATRPAAIQAVTTARDHSKAALARTTHENPDCAALTRPLCPAVARQLFGSPGSPSASR